MLAKHRGRRITENVAYRYDHPGCYTNAEPGDKPYKLFDERGRFLLVTPTGGKWWRRK